MMPVADSSPPKPRPVYLNLVAIRLPVPGIASILHRVSGAALFLFGIPLLLCAVQASLASAESFAALKATFGHPLAKLATVGFAWAYFHHFCAGIRYLLIDVHVGDDLAPARRSSVAVIAISVALTLIVAVRLW
jgi:succinate dehydrogenase / fumarate reductase, cytochrome b subunit